MSTANHLDSQPNARGYYKQQVERLSQLLAEWVHRDRQLSRSRLLLFVIGLALFGSASVFSPYHHWVYGLVAVTVVLFLIAARYQETVIEKRDQAKRLRRWYRHALARLDRKWQDFPVESFDVPDSVTQLARDLDLFGPGSVFQLVDHTSTPRGRAILGHWLISPAEPDVVRTRQRAVASLAGERAMRESLFLRGSTLADSRAEPGEFVAWSAEASWYEAHPRLRLLVPTLSAGFLLSLIAWALSLNPFALVCVLVLTFANSIVCLGWSSSIYRTFNRVSSRHREVTGYRALFTEMQAGIDRISELEYLQPMIGRASCHVLDAMRRLDAVMTLSSLRHAGLLSILHAMLQPTLLWDFHVCTLLDRWKRRYGGDVAGWFDGLGELESLASISVLLHDHPDWVFPDLDDNAKTLQATELGHPLILDTTRVRNDVTVGPVGTLLLVTGSNMSGKSTLLRSIGVNSVLAGAGAPVCATAMQLPPFILATSMRISDSLETGTSYYLAELERLQEIVSLASAQCDGSPRTLLYLLDEVLQGTNSRERHIAVAQVVKHLIESGAIGAITTHDLTLAESPLLASAVVPVHFRESFEEVAGAQRMVFDYLLRPGVATTTNALTLLRMVGLGDVQLDDE